MPLGSSSAAPVMRPGPSERNGLKCFLRGFIDRVVSSSRIGQNASTSLQFRGADGIGPGTSRLDQKPQCGCRLSNGQSAVMKEDEESPAIVSVSVRHRTV